AAVLVSHACGSFRRMNRDTVRPDAVIFCPRWWLNPGISRPASRLLGFLELLQRRLVVDGPSAARELGVSERTIRRYAVALHDIGIPVDGQPGVGGGYRLRAGARLPPLTLADEAAAAAG